MDRRGRCDVAIFLAFALLVLAFVAPVVPGSGRILGGEDLAYFRPPLTEQRWTGHAPATRSTWSR